MDKNLKAYVAAIRKGHEDNPELGHSRDFYVRYNRDEGENEGSLSEVCGVGAALLGTGVKATEINANTHPFFWGDALAQLKKSGIDLRQKYMGFTTKGFRQLKDLEDWTFEFNDNGGLTFEQMAVKLSHLKRATKKEIAHG